MDSNSFIFFLVLILFSFFFYKYLPLALNKYKPGFLIDNQFKKPQAFHDFPISISGGIGLFISFLIACSYLFSFKQIIYYDYLSFCTLFFYLVWLTI